MSNNIREVRCVHCKKIIKDMAAQDELCPENFFDETQLSHGLSLDDHVFLKYGDHNLSLNDFCMSNLTSQKPYLFDASGQMDGEILGWLAIVIGVVVYFLFR